MQALTDNRWRPSLPENEPEIELLRVFAATKRRTRLQKPEVYRKQYSFLPLTTTSPARRIL